MNKKSAGILLYRFTSGSLEVLLVHPGGPFWSKKDLGAWSIPKGEFDDSEEPLAAARREFSEETGSEINGDFMELSPVRNKSGKVVYPFALQHNLDTNTIRSNTFSMEWPPKSGIQQSFPEIDRGDWFDIQQAKQKINTYQMPIMEELVRRLNL